MNAHMMSVIATLLASTASVVVLGCSNEMPEYGYDSFCKDGDNACISREINFIIDNKRGPATDSELMHVYDIESDEELFNSPNQFHTIRALPREVKSCDECFIWEPSKHGPQHAYSVTQIPKD